MNKERLKQKLSNTNLGKDIVKLGTEIASGNYIKAAITILKSKKLRNLLIITILPSFLFFAMPLLALSSAIVSTIMQRPVEDFKPNQIQQIKDQANAWEGTIRWFAGYDNKGNKIWKIGLDSDQIKQVNNEGVNLSWGLIAALKEFGATDTAKVAQELSPTEIEFQAARRYIFTKTKITDLPNGPVMTSEQVQKYWVLKKIVTYNGTHTFRSKPKTYTRILDNGRTTQTITDLVIIGSSWVKDYSPLYKVERPLGITKDKEDQTLLFRQAFFFDPTISDPYALIGLPEFALSGSDIGYSGNFTGKFYSTEYDVTQNSRVTAEQINELLAKTPMHDEGEYFLEAGKKWGIDPAFMVGVAGAEQSFSPFYHNAFGMTDEGDVGKVDGFAAYSSDQIGIFDATRNIAESPYYIKAGKKTIGEIWRVWAPKQAGNDPEGLNANWAKNVIHFMDLLKEEPN